MSFYYCVGGAARKTLLDIKPSLGIKKITIKTSERSERFISQKEKSFQRPTQVFQLETTRRRITNFGSQTRNWVHFVFVSSMKNTALRERLFTEPRDKPEHNIKFAIASEQGVQQVKLITTVTKNVTVKEEPVAAAVERTNECYKCSEALFYISKSENMQSLRCRL